MTVCLETERLVLRECTTADVDDLFDLHNDPEVMRYIDGGNRTPRAEIEQVILPGYLAGYRQHPGYGCWPATERATGAFVGWFSLVPHDDGGAGTASLGYRLRTAAWGKGYATEGSRALVHRAFTDLGVRRVRAETMAVNHRSRRVMAKAGLRHVRTFHLTWDDPLPGTEHGEVEYAIIRQQWLELGDHDVVGVAEARHTPTTS